MAKYATITIRRDNTKNWEAANPRLALGELGVDMTLQRLKVGNGIDNWKDLGYINEEIYQKFDTFSEEVDAITAAIIKNKNDADKKIKKITERQESFETGLTEQFEAAKNALDEGLAEFENEAESLNTRLDVVLGSATEDYEILDARVDAENNTHPNLGHNIRSIHRKILELSEKQESDIETVKEKIQNDINTLDSDERSVRVSQDDGLQKQIDLLAEAVETIILDRTETMRRLREVESSDGNATRATNDEFENMLNDVYTNP